MAGDVLSNGLLSRCVARHESTDGLTRRDLVRQSAALGIAGAVAPFVLSQPVGAVPRRQGDATTLTLVLDGSPHTVDPHNAYDYRSILAVLGAYEGLIMLKDDSTDEYEGLIAESWESNADKSIWTFHLRDGVTFHDGSPVDAAAVVASYERLLAMGLGPVNVIQRFVSDPAQVTAPDAKTVVFDLGRPQPSFEAAIASTYGNPIANVAVMKTHEEDGDWGHAWAEMTAEGTGSGPYRLVEFEPGERLVYEKYEGYWRGWEADHFDRIVIRIVTEKETRRQLIEQGEADIVDSLTPEDFDSLAQHPDLVVTRSYATAVDYYTMTVAGPLASPTARQALCFAFPYEETVEGVYRGYAKQARGGVAELIRGFSPDTFTYSTDLERAKELLAEAVVPEGTSLTMTIESGIERFKSAGQLLQANLASIGIDLKIEQVDLPTFLGIFQGDAPAEERPHLMGWTWWPDYNDAWSHLTPQISCGAWGSKGGNGGFYCNQQAEDLLSQGENAADEATYLSAMAELQQIISRDDPPAIYFVQPQWTTALRKRVTGFLFNPVNVGTFNFWKLRRTD
ncbi:MAG: peptide/nickel transport system substrate-binding protein [Thermomicrobiales bacterium]|nr:peptide/nickel transport system substrate-binding protein [Thermomicrobiales bacterium]